MAGKSNYGYGKRPLWQWVVIYLIIGAIVYAAIYYFVIAKRGGASSGSMYQVPQQSTKSGY